LNIYHFQVLLLLIDLLFYYRHRGFGDRPARHLATYPHRYTPTHPPTHNMITDRNKGGHCTT